MESKKANKYLEARAQIPSGESWIQQHTAKVQTLSIHVCTLSYIFEYFSAEVSRRGWTASRCGMPAIICLFRSDLGEKGLDGPDAAPSGVPTVQSAWSEGGKEHTHTHNHINTNVIYLKTFATMVNRSGKDSRILQLRFNRENHVGEKSQSRAQRRCGGQRKWFFLYVGVQNVPPQLVFSWEIHT